MSDHITITLDRSDEVIDLVDFAALFAGLGSQFDDFLKDKHPEVHGHARMGIRKLNEGSIIAELAAVIAADTIAAMDATVVMRDFLGLVRSRYDTLGDGRFLDGARKKDLGSIVESVGAIAKDADASATYEHLEYDRHGRVKSKERFSLVTSRARQITETAEKQKAELDKTEGVDRERVLMVFTRADVSDAPLDKKSGERVLIEEITDKSLALIYQSNLAEQRIKSEIRDADSVFRKGLCRERQHQNRPGHTSGLCRRPC